MSIPRNRDKLTRWQAAQREKPKLAIFVVGTSIHLPSELNDGDSEETA